MRCFVTVSPFCHTCASLLANKLDKASNYLLSTTFSLINFEQFVYIIHFLSIIVFSSEATSLIANRNPSLYDSSIFNLFNSLSVICGKSFLNLSSELIGFFLFDFFSRFSASLFSTNRYHLCLQTRDYINFQKVETDGCRIVSVSEVCESFLT